MNMYTILTFSSILVYYNNIYDPNPVMYKLSNGNTRTRTNYPTETLSIKINNIEIFRSEY